MDSSHSSSPPDANHTFPNEDATITHTPHGRPEDYDSSFEDWLEEPEGASVPSRKGKGKMYQIFSSSSKHSTPSPRSDEDSDYEASDKGRKGASSNEDHVDDSKGGSPQGAPGGRTSIILPSPETSPKP